MFGFFKKKNTHTDDRKFLFAGKVMRFQRLAEPAASADLPLPCVGVSTGQTIKA